MPTRISDKTISKLTAKQIEAALLLAAGKTITEAGNQTETARQTIHTWLKDDAVFIAHLNGLKSEVVEAGRAQIQTSVSLAITTICQIMEHSENDVARFNCAKEILFMAGLSRELKIGPVTIEAVQKQRKDAESLENLWS